MMNLIFYLYLYSFFFVLLSYVLNRNHVLMMLITIEFISLMLFFFIYMKLYYMVEEQYFLMIYLTFCVCEGVIGLSLLVSMIRSHSTDFLSSINFLKC